MSNKNLKIGKGLLYFDRNLSKYIEFDLEKNKTCKEIYNNLGKKIKQYISEIYGKESSNKKFDFILINSQTNNKSNNSSLIELKLDHKMDIITFMNNNIYYLCYLPISKNDIELKRSKRNNIEEKKGIYIGVEMESLITHNIEKYLENEGIYWFDKTIVQFVFCKGNIDEKKLEIITKTNTVTISMNSIRKVEYYENNIPPSIEGLNIKSPTYIFQIYYNNFGHIFGLYKPKSFFIWKNAINLARTKYNNNSVNCSLNNDINTYNFQFYVRSHSIPNKCFEINQIIENAEKRNIFLGEFHDKTISSIVSNIYSYKIFIKKNKFFESWMCVKQISFYVDFNNIDDEAEKRKEMEKYSNVFTQERINLYNNITKKINEDISQIKDMENYEKEMNNILKNIFDISLFDDLYAEIYELYILPFFQEIKGHLSIEYEYDKKPPIVKKYHLLLSKYCMSFFDMKNIDNFNFLCSSYSKNNDVDFNINSSKSSSRNNSNIINISSNSE